MPGCYFSRRENRGVPVVGWTHENEVQQGEEMPGVRPADEEERSDREGVQRWKCASCSLSSTMPQENTERAGQLDAFLGWLLGRASQSACDANGDSRALRKRTAWCRNIRPAIPPCRVKHHTVMADGTYMNHGWCLVIAIDGGNGEVPGFQWCSNESKAAYMALFSRIPAPDVPITDGLRGAESACNVQRCLVHVLRNTRVDLTNRPKSEAGRALLRLARRLTKISTVDGAANWLAELNAWHGEHGDYLKERTTAKQDPAHARGRKWWWTHERLRRACFRLVRLNRAGMLFAFCDPAIAGGRRIVAVDHEPAGRRDQRGCQAHARPPPGTVGRAYETVLRMDGVYAHGTSRPHVVRHARLLEIHRKGTGGGRRADARDRDRRATAGRRRRRLRGRVRHQERLERTLSLTHRHAIDTHDKTHFFFT